LLPSLGAAATLVVRRVAEEVKVNTLNKAMNVFAMVIAAGFVVLGFCITLEVFDMEFLDAKFRLTFGVVFILYGLLRLATALTHTSQQRAPKT